MVVMVHTVVVTAIVAGCCCCCWTVGSRGARHVPSRHPYRSADRTPPRSAPRWYCTPSPADRADARSKNAPPRAAPSSSRTSGTPTVGS